MASIPIAQAVVTQRRDWITPTILVAAHALFNLVVDPFQQNYFHWSFMLAGGVFYVQPVLFGAWAALGPSPAVRRIPLTLTAYATVLIAPAITRQFVRGQSVDSWYFVAMSVVFVITFITTLLLRRFARWRIDVLPTAAGAFARIGQFSLRNLLVFTAICAALLSAGRAIAPTAETGSMSVAEVLFGIGVVFVVLVPAVVAPLATLANRLPRSFFVVFPFVWAALTVGTVYAVMRTTSDSDAETAIFIVLVQIGALLGGLASALILRFNGYRLFRCGAAANRPPALNP